MPRRPTRRFEAPVVGVSFRPGYPDNLLDLEDLQRRRRRRGKDDRLRVDLVRNPKNKHDPNAIEVHTRSEGHIGHLPADVAQRLAPCLDAGETWEAWLLPIRISMYDDDQPGAHVYVEYVRGKGKRT